VPGRDSATITVEFADGSTPETVTAPATFEEHRTRTGVVSGRSLTATFGLSVGQVRVSVEWTCPDDMEAVSSKG
jgi:hypothetical protein